MLLRILLFLLFPIAIYAQVGKPIVFQTDFGLRDGAVAEMKGIALMEDRNLRLYDLTHEIRPFSIWEAAFRLQQVIPYWPKGTIFVSVVDPGVGTERKSVVLKTKTGHYVVSPDNGTLTVAARLFGIEELREIDSLTLSRGGLSGRSHTFHGRDVYAYTAARLASGKVKFSQVGALLPPKVFELIIPEPEVFINSAGETCVRGIIDVLDGRYGNLWTSINDSLLGKIGVSVNDSLKLGISKTINGQASSVLQQSLLFGATFGQVQVGESLVYINSIGQVSIAINQGNFAEKFNIGAGPEWQISLCKYKD